jgi:peptidoglycan/LPS O-acetylase OafA/YrhL
MEECSTHPDLPFAKWIVLLGACGVDIFFVISGFVIWRTTGGLGAGTSARTFMRKRLLRVLPLYWLFLILVVVLWGTGLAFRGAPASPMSLAGSFLLLPPGEGRWLVMGIAWTLVYELYFYVLCGIALCSRHAKSRPLLLIGMLAIVPRLLVAVGAVEAGRWYGDPIVMEFVLGCMIARCSDALGRMAFARWAAVAGIVGLIAAARLLESDGTAGLASGVRWWGWGLPAAMLVAACVAGLRIPDRFGGRGAIRLGDESYALYLSHWFVMIGLARLLKSGVAPDVPSTLALGLGAILLALLLSHVIHVRIERPAMRWLGIRFGVSKASRSISS